MTYKWPILAIFFYIIGVIVLTSGIAAAMLSPATASISEIQYVVYIICIILLSLLFIGIGDVISYLGRTAYHARSIDAALTAHLDQMQKTNTEILEHLKTLSPAPPILPPPVKTAKCPHCGEGISLQGIQRGMNTCPACKKEFEVV